MMRLMSNSFPKKGTHSYTPEYLLVKIGPIPEYIRQWNIFYRINDVNPIGTKTISKSRAPENENVQCNSSGILKNFSKFHILKFPQRVQTQTGYLKNKPIYPFQNI